MRPSACKKISQPIWASADWEGEYEARCVKCAVVEGWARDVRGHKGKARASWHRCHNDKRRLERLLNDIIEKYPHLSQRMRREQARRFVVEVAFRCDVHGSIRKSREEVREFLQVYGKQLGSQTRDFMPSPCGSILLSQDHAASGAGPALRLQDESVLLLVPRIQGECARHNFSRTSLHGPANPASTPGGMGVRVLFFVRGG